jgi:hypothetical protein
MEGNIEEIELQVHIKKAGKHNRQYYGIIDTSDFTAGKYRIDIDMKDVNN